MKSELAQLFADHSITIPDGFDGLRHTVGGGTSGTLLQNQAKVTSLMGDLPWYLRAKLKDVLQIRILNTRNLIL